jgi:hypothetical protein
MPCITASAIPRALQPLQAGSPDTGVAPNHDISLPVDNARKNSTVGVFLIKQPAAFPSTPIVGAVLYQAEGQNRLGGIQR